MIQQYPAVFALERDNHTLLIGGPRRDIAEHFSRSSTFERHYKFRPANGSLRSASPEQRRVWNPAATRAHPDADIVVTPMMDA